MEELARVELVDSDGSPLALTEHNGRESLWAAEFERRRSDRARLAYAASPEALPQEVRSYFEAIWQDLAAYQMAGMGHVPFRSVAFDPESEVTLLELPSSELMGWWFGDVDNLVLSIKRTTLAAGRFTGLKVQWSN